MKRILVFCLILLTLVQAGCVGGEVVDDVQTTPSVTTVAEDEAPFDTSTDTSTDTSEESRPASDTLSLLDHQDGKAVYRIIVPESKSQGESQAAIDLNKALREATGTAFKLTSDFLIPPESLESVADVPEILIGATNRPESAQVLEGLTAYEYAICVVNFKIVIAGGSDIMVYHAMQQFLDMVTLTGDFSLSKNTNIRQKVEREPYLVALTNQGKSRLEVYDISKGTLDESSLMWSYELPKYNIAGAKLRHSEKYGDVALAVCGNYYGYMISYPEGKLLWRTDATAKNPHSIELMPNGVIAVASSTGGEVRFFTTTGNYSDAPAASMTLTDAHGVLWDDERQILWAIGRRVLTAYRVTLNTDGSVSVAEDAAFRATIPTDNAHDLAPVYGDKNLLWISTGSNVYQFNKTTKAFSTNYDGNKYLNRSGIKGVGNFDDGSIVYIYPDGEFKSWTSRSMTFVVDGGGVMASAVFTSETGHFYKVRVWDTRYQ